MHSVASFFVSRVDTEVDKRLEALGREELRGRPRSRTRAPPTCASRRSSTASASPRCARPGARAAAAVGVDRHEEPALPRHQVRRRSWWRRDTVNTMPMPTLLACRRAREVSGRDRGPGSVRRAERARRRRHRHGRRDGEAARDGIEKFVEPFDEADRRASSSSREAVVTGRPPTIQSLAPGRARAGDRRAASSRREAEDVAQRVWRTDDTLWGGPGCPRSQPSGLADHRRPDARAGGRPARVRARRPARTGSPTRSLLGMGGSSLGPEVIRRSFGEIAGRHAPARARLDRPRRGARDSRARSISTRRCSSSRPSPAARSRRCRTFALLLRAHAGGDGRASCADHGPGQPARGPRSRARLPAGVRERPGHRRALLGAVILRPRAGRAGGRERRGHARTGSGGRAELRAVRRRPEQLGAVARAA